MSESKARVFLPLDIEKFHGGWRVSGRDPYGVWVSLDGLCLSSALVQMAWAQLGVPFPKNLDLLTLTSAP